MRNKARKYYSQLFTIQLIFFQCLSCPLFAQLQAGVSKVNITGPIASTMYGYGARGSNLSTGVHDSLYARVLVLDDGRVKLGIATLDWGAIYARNTQRIRKALPSDHSFNQILLIASHSHSTPTNYDDFPSEEDPWIKEAEKRIAGALVAADQSRQMGRFH